MPSSALIPATRASNVSRERVRGFSLVEVILALGVIAIAIVSVLGLIAPTLNEVQQTEDLNAGTACIAKMNSLIDAAPFWDSAAGTSGETVWQWIADSHSDSPTVFLFYDEIPSTGSGVANPTPVQRVVRFNVTDSADALNVPEATMVIQVAEAGMTNFPIYVTMNQFLADVNSSSVSGPVIAMTLSLSPLAQHFPVAAATSGPYASINEQSFYVAPAQNVLNGLFSDTAFGSFLTDPDGFKSQMPFPEAYLPIYVQAFNVSIAGLQSTTGAVNAENQIINTFSTGNRLFTYTTAKLR